MVKKAFLNGGTLMLVLVFLVVEIFVSVFPNLKSIYPLPKEARQWVVWGIWGWLVLNIPVSLWVGRKAFPRWRFSCAFSLEWVQALLPLALGALVAMLGGEVRQGVAIAWVSLPWAALLIWQTLHQTRS